MDVFAPVLEGQNLRYCGVGAGYDDIIINGNPDELKVCGMCANQEHLLNSCAIVRRILREGGHNCRRRFVSGFDGCPMGVRDDTYPCCG